MGSSFVGIDRKGFWMNDSILELWLRLLALHVEDSPEEHPLAHAIRDEWLIASRGYFTGCVPLSLGSNVATPEGRQIVLSAIDSLLEALRLAPEVLDAGVLNVMGMSGRFRAGFETERLIEVGAYFVRLINGEPFGDASAAAHWPGRRYPASPGGAAGSR